MEKKFFTLILAAVLAVVVGVGIVTKQVKDPILHELLKRQVDVLRAQHRIENRLAANQQVSSEAGVSQNYQTLENRIIALESQLRNLQAEMQQARAAVPQMPPGPPPEDLTTVHQIPIAHTQVVGPKNAPVTIVEFVDFQCPFCSRFHSPMVEAAKENSSKVNYLIKNYPLPFHPQARPAAKAALAAAEQGKYSEMAHALFENNQNLNDETFEKVAKSIGLNVGKFLKDYHDKDAQWEKYVQDDIDLGNQVGVNGTPTFFINGRKTQARDVGEWKKEIDQELNK